MSLRNRMRKNFRGNFCLSITKSSARQNAKILICNSFHRGSKRYPPFRKHCARELFFEGSFSEGLREIVAIDCAK